MINRNQETTLVFHRLFSKIRKNRIISGPQKEMCKKRSNAIKLKTFAMNNTQLKFTNLILGKVHINHIFDIFVKVLFYSYNNNVFFSISVCVILSLLKGAIINSQIDYDTQLEFSVLTFLNDIIINLNTC